MIEINHTLFIQLVNFLIMVLFLHFFLFKPIMEVVERRNGKMNSMKNDTAKFLQNAEKAVENYEKKLEEMKKVSSGILHAARQEAMEQQEKILREAREKFTEQIDKAKGEIENQSKKALETLHKEAGKISSSVAQKILGRSI